MPKYGLKFTITRTDLPGIELTINLDEVDREFVSKSNPALDKAFEAFDEQVNLLRDEGFDGLKNAGYEEVKP